MRNACETTSVKTLVRYSLSVAFILSSFVWMGIVFPARVLAADKVNQVLNPSASKVNFEIASSGLNCDGKFTKFSGTFDYNPGRVLDSHVNLSLDLSSVVMPPDQLMQALLVNTLVEQLRSKIATFESTSIEKAGNNEFLVNGFYTWEGKRRSASVPFKFLSASPKSTEIRVNLFGKVGKKEVNNNALSGLGDSFEGKAISTLVFQSK